MQSLQWVEEWQHDVVHARREDQLLPPDAHLFLISHGLPRVMIFECRNSFEISFSPLGKELTCFSAVVPSGEVDKDWDLQVIIGEELFSNGSASFCVHQQTGEVSRIDCKKPELLSFVNSSVVQFGKSLHGAMKWSEALHSNGTALSPKSCDVLAKELEAIDARAFQSQDTFWGNVIELYRTTETADFEITNDPLQSKPRI